jgi:UDP-N-acetylmuramoylalanine--D-glutamate ligase
MNFLMDKRVLVLGLGESGLACARFAHLHGARIVVADTRNDPASPPPQLARLKAVAPDAELRLGEFDAALLEGIDRIAISPGLSPDAPAVKQILDTAVARGIPVDSEIEWFALALAELREQRHYDPRIVAITGTNGKTTVTMLTLHLAQSAGQDAIACGNVSPAALDALADAMQAQALPAIWILELSSFQLHFTRSLQAHAATVLNLSQDHLDWHGSMHAYSADKARIFAPATVRILNRDDSMVMAMRPDPKTPTPVVTFGLHPPAAIGDWGVLEDGALRWLVHATAQDDIPRKKGMPAPDVFMKRLMPADALRIRGSHNHANALAGLALLSAIHVPLSAMLHGLRDYTGEPHRAQFVAAVEGVDFIDDSKGTNVGATMAAVQGLAEGKKRIVLIAGGQGKGQDFSALAHLKSYIKAVVVMGVDAEKIEAALREHIPSIERAAAMDEAVDLAARHAVAGDVVLLSPACASLDMFKNYVHRAEVFVAAVHELAHEVGQT